MNELFERFIAKVDISGDCWLWMASTDGVGYGKMKMPNDRLLGAHQISYMLFNGNLMSGKDIMHSCDNRICVNPRHLSLGTRRDNIQDMITKGRRRSIQTYARQSGEKNASAKITYKDAEDIRTRRAKTKESYSSIAKDYRVSIQLIYRVVKKGAYAT